MWRRRCSVGYLSNEHVHAKGGPRTTLVRVVEPGAEAVLAQVWLNEASKPVANHSQCCVLLSQSSGLHVTCFGALNAHAICN